MNKNTLLMHLLILPTLTFATTAPVQPTESSKPLPSLSKTKNLDTVTTEKLQLIITKVPALKNQPVTAVIHEGIVTLTGSVDSKQQEQAAIHAVKSVRGVRKVKSQLTIKFAPLN